MPTRPWSGKRRKSILTLCSRERLLMRVESVGDECQLRERDEDAEGDALGERMRKRSRSVRLTAVQ